jgi:hypothetical protein
MRAARLYEIGGVPQVDETDEPCGEATLDVSSSPLNDRRRR